MKIKNEMHAMLKQHSESINMTIGKEIQIVRRAVDGFDLKLKEMFVRDYTKRKA